MVRFLNKGGAYISSHSNYSQKMLYKKDTLIYTTFKRICLLHFLEREIAPQFRSRKLGKLDGCLEMSEDWETWVVHPATGNGTPLSPLRHGSLVANTLWFVFLYEMRTSRERVKRPKSFTDSWRKTKWGRKNSLKNWEDRPVKTCSKRVRYKKKPYFYFKNYFS